LAVQISECMVLGGFDCSTIGIVSPYRAQVKMIKHLLGNKPIEASTIDKYQGRDKDCIIVSFVRSNPRGNIGFLLNDWRRVNVVLSRAKKKAYITRFYIYVERESLIFALNKFDLQKRLVVRFT